MATIRNVHRDGRTFRMGDTQSKVLVEPAMGARHVTFNYIRYEAGAEFPQHVHEASEDVFFVLEGTGWLREGDQLSPIGPGDVVFVPAGQQHGTVAGPAGMIVISCQGPKLYTGERDRPRM
jgi:quercetin dioxygenase-like cupin family protein